MRVRLSAFVLPLCCAALSGCGGNAAPGPDAGTSAEAMETYFGLQVGRCFEYTTADLPQAAPDLGVVVESIDSKQFAVPTHVVVYTSGGVAMREYVAFDGSALLLYKREFPGGKSYIYDPPLTRLVDPVVESSTLNASASVTIRDGSGTVLGKEAHDLRVDVFPKADLKLPGGQTASSMKLAFSETLAGTSTPAGRAEYRTFAPGTGDKTAFDGFVKIDFNFELDESAPNLIFQLQKVRDLGATPATARPTCGSAL